METGNIYHENVNGNESIYDFLAAQEDTTKILLFYKIDPTISFKYYLKEIIAPVKNGRDGLGTNSTSKFFFNHFNNFRNDHNLHGFKIRYTKIWENDFAVEPLQTRNWQYYIERKLNFIKFQSNL